MRSRASTDRARLAREPRFRPRSARAAGVCSPGRLQPPDVRPAQVPLAAMSLAQAWGRKLLGASGVALVVPAAIVGAVAALVLAGGFGRLGTLGQAFSGPSIPALERAGGADG